MCYVGKATKIFIFIVIVLAAVGFILGFGLLRHGVKKSHKCETNCPPIFPDPIPATASPGFSSPITETPHTPSPDREMSSTQTPPESNFVPANQMTPPPAPVNLSPPVISNSPPAIDNPPPPFVPVPATVSSPQLSPPSPIAVVVQGPQHA